MAVVEAMGDSFSVPTPHSQWRVMGRKTQHCRTGWHSTPHLILSGQFVTAARVCCAVRTCSRRVSRYRSS